VKEIRDLITPEYVFLELSGKTRFDVIHNIIQRMSGVAEIEDLDKFEDEVVRREKEIPTGLQMGAALPHARSKTVKQIIMAFARLKEGVDFGADSKQPARLIFLFGVPSDAINEYLKLVAKLCRLLRKQDFREKLLSADTVEDVMDVIQSA